jgi:predicted restriction endonuclease
MSILDLAEIEDIVPASNNLEDFNVPDSWGITKIRGALKRFSDPVLRRSNSKCVICGTSLPGLVEAGHIIPYASDHNNRANPANGIALCKYCHCAFDLRLIAIQNDGELLVAPSIDKGDKIAALHFSRVDKKERLVWLQGVDHNFLEIAVQWYKDNLAK